MDTRLTASDEPLDIALLSSGSNIEEAAQSTQQISCQEYKDYEKPCWPADVPFVLNPVAQVQVDPEADTRVLELLRNEQLLNEQVEHIPLITASLEDREALYAAEYGYEPSPTDSISEIRWCSC